jgi:transposase-like protein
VLLQPLEPGQYLAIRYTERLAEAGAVASVGSRGDSYDNALAETVNGLFKTELIRRQRSWRSSEQVELATARWVQWWNERRLVLERMLAGVATRRHVDVGEPVGVELDKRSRSTSKSAVSRRFTAATQAKLTELLARDLSTLDVAVLMVDGLYFAGRCIVVALIITVDGTKVPVGIWDGDTENTTVVTGLLADLVDRGLRFDEGILVVIDGAKALRKAVRKVFGDRALVQRCVLHKRRNLPVLREWRHGGRRRGAGTGFSCRKLVVDEATARRS